MSPAYRPSSLVLTQAILDAATGKVGVIIAGLAYLTSAYDSWRSGGTSYRWETVVGAVVIALAAPLALGIAAVLRGGSPRRWLRAFVVIGLGAALAHPLLTRDPGADQGYPPLWHVISGAMCITPVAFGPAAGWFVAPAFALVCLLVRIPAVGTAQGLLESLVFLTTGLLCAQTLRVLRSASAAVEAAAHRAWAAYEQAAQADERTRARRRWDALVHDKVLGALRLAGQGGGPDVQAAARELAADAALALRSEQQPSRPDLSLPEAARRHAERWGLQVRIEDPDGAGITDTDASEAICDAIGEALANVARHSGQQHALVRIEPVDEGGVDVLVSDPGIGPQGPAGAGITLGIGERMAAVGGTGQVGPGPDGGTEVRLTWRPAALPELPVADNPGGSTERVWSERAFYSLLGLGLVAMGTHAVIGLSYLPASRAPGWHLVGLAGLIGLTYLVARGPTGLGATVALIVGYLGLSIGFTALLAQRLPYDWRYWFIGALDLPAAALSFRFRPWAGLALAAAMPVGILGYQLGLGDPQWWAVFGSMSSVAGSAAMGAFGARAMDACSAAIAESANRAGVARLQAVRSGEREQESDRRLALLGRAVLPLLDRVAAGSALSDLDRAGALALEAQARDQLVAGPALTPALAEAIGAARRRGALVQIWAHDAAPTPALTTFRTVCRVLAEAAGPGARVVIQWRPQPSGRLGSVTLVGPRATDAVAAVHRAATRSGGAAPDADLAVRVSADEAALLVEFVDTTNTLDDPTERSEPTGRPTRQPGSTQVLAG